MSYFKKKPVNLGCNSHQPSTSINLTDYSELNGNLAYVVFSDLNTNYTQDFHVSYKTGKLMERKLCKKFDISFNEAENDDVTELRNNLIYECSDMIKTLYVNYFDSKDNLFNLDVYI